MRRRWQQQQQQWRRWRKRREGGGGGGTIALLLPETKTSRYEAHDRPEFEEKVEELCPECEVIYSNANQSTSEQQSQGEAAITQGADVIVLDAVDATAVGSVVLKANQEEIPVVSYDRLILGSPISYYISFDNEKVGELQAEALIEKLAEEGSPKGPIVMINGSPTDPNAGQFKAGAHKVFEQEGIEIAKEYDTPDWSPDQAQNEMEQAITALGKNGFAGVYAANDGTAGGAIAAMKSAGIKPETKPITGQDAELEAIQRILVGEQFMTVYKRSSRRPKRPPKSPSRWPRAKKSRPAWSTAKPTTKSKKCPRSCSTRSRSRRKTSTKRSSPTNSGRRLKSAPAPTRRRARKPVSNRRTGSGAGRERRPAPCR